MTKVSIDILVPVFNEGEKILRLLKLFEKILESILSSICYDHDNDDIFSFKIF